MCKVLEKNNYKAYQAKDGLDALQVFSHEHIDLMISDIMMPNMDGYQLTESLRKANYNLPVLMVTAKEQFKDKQNGFLAGTDDYMVKPIDFNEMILRVGALLRRAKIANEHRLELPHTVLDYDSLTVTTDGEVIVLPQKEFLLLFKLLSYPGRIFTRQKLMEELWGMDSDSEIRTVDVHINRLRERFKENIDFDIVTVRGLGYKVVKKYE